ncbi:hypothetical protein [Phenylobacterium sp.]
MIRKFDPCTLRLVGFGSAKAETNGFDEGIEEDGGGLVIPG